MADRAAPRRSLRDRRVKNGVRRVDQMGMDPYDFFHGSSLPSVAPQTVLPPARPPATGMVQPILTSPAAASAPSRRGHIVVVAGILVVALAVVALMARGGGASTARDTAALPTPDAVMGEQLESDGMLPQWQQQMAPILGAIFGGRPAIAERYEALQVRDGFAQPISTVNLLAGRGPVVGRPAGDVRGAAQQRRRFGDITCAYSVYKGTVLTSLEVCWYSTPTFGASALFEGDGQDSATHAAALQSVLPTLLSAGSN